MAESSSYQIGSSGLKFQTPGGPLVLPVWVLFNPPPDTENSSAWQSILFIICIVLYSKFKTLTTLESTCVVYKAHQAILKRKDPIFWICAFILCLMLMEISLNVSPKMAIPTHFLATTYRQHWYSKLLCKIDIKLDLLFVLQNKLGKHSVVTESDGYQWLIIIWLHGSSPDADTHLRYGTAPCTQCPGWRGITNKTGKEGM